MLNHYLVLAVKVLLRRKFFTFISLFGISFTLLVLTVVAALFDHSFGPGVEEPLQDRTLYAGRAVMYGKDSTWSSNGGFRDPVVAGTLGQRGTEHHHANQQGP